MTDTYAGENRKRPAHALRNLTSAVLILFTLVTGVACVVALASTLTQARISSVTIEGVPVSIWKLDAIRTQWSSLRAQVARQAEALSEADAQRVELSDRRSAAVAKANASESALARLIKDLSARIQPVDNVLSVALGSDIDLLEKMSKIKAADGSLRGNIDLNSAGLLDSIQKASAESLDDSRRLLLIDAEKNGLLQKIKTLQEGLKTSQDNISSIFRTIRSDKPELDEATRVRIENALYELDPAGSVFGGLMNKLVTLQPDVLALSLVLLMGILGSALQILNSVFIGHRIESIGSYVLRLSVGAITALVIFIVSKAGVPVIADTSKLGGDAPINPYFVSFLAIISGLLSEQAIITVQNQGRRFFGSGEKSEPDRWARANLTTARMETENVTLKALADYLGSSEKDALSILKGQIKATFTQQRTTAIFLRSSIRELFSDIAPPSLEVAAEQGRQTSGNERAPNARNDKSGDSDRLARKRRSRGGKR